MSLTAQVLSLEVNQSVAAALKEQFDETGEFDLINAEGEKELRSLMKEHPHFDMVLIDCTGIGASLRELITDIRDCPFKGPIILIRSDKDQSLDASTQNQISDVVPRPFRYSVLLARMRAHLRSHQHSEDAIVQIGPYEFHPAPRLLVKEDRSEIKLTDKEAAILRFLFRAGDEPTSRETLLEEVWGYNSGVTTHTLETHIYRLRQKIEPDAGQATILITDQGGYRLA